MVMKAATEYKENPLIQAVCRCCILDQALFICMCKHHRASGITEMTIDNIWDRFQDMLDKYPSHVIETPPWTVFEESIARLVNQGLLIRKDLKSNFSIDYAIFSPRLSHSDIEIALRQAAGPFSSELPNSDVI
jgi:3-methyladenine DNA glycosylase Tag